MYRHIYTRWPRVLLRPSWNHPLLVPRIVSPVSGVLALRGPAKWVTLQVGRWPVVAAVTMFMIKLQKVRGPSLSAGLVTWVAGDSE